MEVDVHTPELVAVGVDGSIGSRAALAWAVEEARAHGRHLCVYHCWQRPVMVSTVMSGDLPPMHAWQDSSEAAAAVVDELTMWLRSRHPTLPTTVTALEGPAGCRLVAHVRRGDLLVLGLG